MEEKRTFQSRGNIVGDVTDGVPQESVVVCARPFNPLYAVAMDELFANLKNQELPKVVHARLALVLENPLKLFCCVGHAEPALGTARVEPALYASDRLVELVAAAKALDWERTAVLLEQAISPSATLIEEVSRYQSALPA
jgi:hypothetical protein